MTRMKKLSLSLTLTPERQAVSKEELPDAIVRLSNDGDEAMLVNGRMLLVPEGASSRLDGLHLLIEGPPETFSLKKFRVNADEPAAGDMVRLSPGEYIEKRYALKDYFYYDQPGQYKIKATFHNELSNEASFEISN